MSKRRYTNMITLLPGIERMPEVGMSHREIEEKLGLEGARPVHNLLKRQRRKAAKGEPKFRGRKTAKTLQEIVWRMTMCVEKLLYRRRLPIIQVIITIY